MVRAVIQPGFAALTSFERDATDRIGLESALRELAATVLVSGAMPDALIAPIRAVHDFLLSSPAFQEIEWGPVRPPEVEIVSGRTEPDAPRASTTDPVGERRRMLTANSWERSALGRRLLVNAESLPRGHFTTVVMTDGDALALGIQAKLQLWFGRTEFGVEGTTSEGAALAASLPYGSPAEAAMLRRNIRVSFVRALAVAFRDGERD